MPCDIWDLIFPTRNQTSAPILEAQRFNHWIARKVPPSAFFCSSLSRGAPFSPPKHSEPSSCTTTCFFPVSPSPFCFTPPFPIYLNYPSIYHQLVFAPLAKHHKSWLKPFMMSHNPAFWPGEFHGQRSLAGYNPWSHKELDRTERLPLHFSSVRDLSSSSVLGQHIWGWML